MDPEVHKNEKNPPFNEWNPDECIRAQCPVVLPVPPSVNQYDNETTDNAIIVHSSSTIQVPNCVYWRDPNTDSNRRGESHWAIIKKYTRQDRAKSLVVLHPPHNQYCGIENVIIVSSGLAIEVPNCTYWTHSVTNTKRKGESLSHWVLKDSIIYNMG